MLGLRTWTPVTTPPSTLRHTFGKSALDAGVDLVTVSRLIGHERLETTAIYTVPSAHPGVPRQALGVGDGEWIRRSHATPSRGSYGPTRPC
jgi:integrase